MQIRQVVVLNAINEMRLRYRGKRSRYRRLANVIPEPAFPAFYALKNGGYLLIKKI
jgi:hypothetical protein